MASQSPHLFETSDDGTTYTPTRLLVHGTSTVPVLFTAAGYGVRKYYSSSGASGALYGEYIQMKATGAGTATAIAHRSRVYLTAIIGNAYGNHSTLELDTTAGSITGLGVGMRGNLVVADRAIAAGTYYGTMAEIFALGNSAALPAGSNACLGINLEPGTAMDLVGNAISFGGTDGSGKMIYTATDTHQTFVGTIRILVNGVARYLHFTDAEAGTS